MNKNRTLPVHGNVSDLHYVLLKVCQRHSWELALIFIVDKNGECMSNTGQD